MRRLLVAMMTMAALCAAHAKPLSPPDEQDAERTEANCRIEAREQNLAGKKLQNAVQGCVAQESPNLAYWQHCRQGAQNRHLKGFALRDDVKACMSREP